jgi:hypothetical protein
VAEVKALKKDLADLYEQRNYEILESVSKQDIDKATLRDKVVSAAICSDKMRLLREQSSSNINVQVLFEVLEAIRRRDQAPKYDILPAPPGDLRIAPESSRTPVLKRGQSKLSLPGIPVKAQPVQPNWTKGESADQAHHQQQNRK